FLKSGLSPRPVMRGAAGRRLAGRFLRAGLVGGRALSFRARISQAAALRCRRGSSLKQPRPLLTSSAKQATDDFRSVTVVDLHRALGLLLTDPAAALLFGEKGVVLFNRYAVVTFQAGATFLFFGALAKT